MAFRSRMFAVQAELSAAALLTRWARDVRDVMQLLVSLVLEPEHVSGDGALVNALSSSLGRRRRKKLRKILGEETSAADLAGVDFEAWCVELRALAAAEALRRDATPLRTALRALIAETGCGARRGQRRPARAAHRGRTRRARSLAAHRRATGWPGCERALAAPVPPLSAPHAARAGRDRIAGLRAPGGDRDHARRGRTVRPDRGSAAAARAASWSASTCPATTLSCASAHTWCGAGPDASVSAGMGIAFDEALRAPRTWRRFWSAGPISAKPRDQVRAASDQRASSNPRDATVLPDRPRVGVGQDRRARAAGAARGRRAPPPRGPRAATPRSARSPIRSSTLWRTNSSGKRRPSRIQHALVVEHHGVVEGSAAREAARQSAPPRAGSRRCARGRSRARSSRPRGRGADRLAADRGVREVDRVEISSSREGSMRTRRSPSRISKGCGRGAARAPPPARGCRPRGSGTRTRRRCRP